MALLHQCGNGHWMVNVSNCKELMKKEDESQIDVENVDRFAKTSARRLKFVL